MRVSRIASCAALVLTSTAALPTLIFLSSCCCDLRRIANGVHGRILTLAARGDAEAVAYLNSPLRNSRPQSFELWQAMPLLVGSAIVYQKSEATPQQRARAAERERSHALQTQVSQLSRPALLGPARAAVPPRALSPSSASPASSLPAAAQSSPRRCHVLSPSPQPPPCQRQWTVRSPSNAARSEHALRFCGDVFFETRADAVQYVEATRRVAAIALRAAQEEREKDAASTAASAAAAATVAKAAARARLQLAATRSAGTSAQRLHDTRKRSGVVQGVVQGAAQPRSCPAVAPPPFCSPAPVARAQSIKAAIAETRAPKARSWKGYALEVEKCGSFDADFNALVPAAPLPPRACKRARLASGFQSQGTVSVSARQSAVIVSAEQKQEQKQTQTQEHTQEHTPPSSRSLAAEATEAEADCAGDILLGADDRASVCASDAACSQSPASALTAVHIESCAKAQTSAHARALSTLAVVDKPCLDAFVPLAVPVPRGRLDLCWDVEADADMDLRTLGIDLHVPPERSQLLWAPSPCTDSDTKSFPEAPAPLNLCDPFPLAVTFCGASAPPHARPVARDRLHSLEEWLEDTSVHFH